MKSKADSQGTWYFDYDRENRLIKATKLGFGPDARRSVVYQYDALGRRVSRQERKTIRTEFTYDGMDVIQDRKSDGSIVNYVNGLGIDDKLKQTIGSSTSYFLTDHLGSTVGLVDQAGTITSQTSYDSFGNATSSLPTRYGYTGRELDEYTGLMYYRARFYDSQIGRFISEDPIGFRGGKNWYAYVNNKPVKYRDPRGLDDADREWEDRFRVKPNRNPWWDSHNEWADNEDFERSQPVGGGYDGRKGINDFFNSPFWKSYSESFVESKSLDPEFNPPVCPFGQIRVIDSNCASYVNETCGAGALGDWLGGVSGLGGAVVGANNPRAGYAVGAWGIYKAWVAVDAGVICSKCVPIGSTRK